MKKFNLSMLAMAGLLFASCADKEIVEGGGQNETRSEGYVSLAINLPTTPFTRAANDDFDDGDDNEYEVNDCALLLFQGTQNGKEEDAILLNAQAIILRDKEKPDDNDNITETHYNAVAKVSDFDNNGTNKLYALVLLNYRNIMSINTQNGVPTIAGSEQGNGTTFGKIRNLTTDADLISRDGDSYFFMTNAVLSKAMGGAVTTAPAADDIFQLAELDCSKIEENEAAAKAKPAGEIFVERAVAKVTLDYSTDAWKLNDKMAIASVEWTIDNKEPNSYVVRNPGQSEYVGYTSGYFTWADADPARKANYRFVGSETLYGSTTLGTKGTDDIYRSYWCIDPQYETDAIDMIRATHFGATKKDEDLVPQYCYENTFDVDYQNYKNTTRAIIKVTLKKADGSDGTPTFYTVNGGTEYYLDENDATSYILDNIIVNTDIVNAFKESLVKGGSYDFTKDDFTATYTRDNITGQLKITGLTIKDATLNNENFTSGQLSTKFNAVKQQVMAAANQSVIVREYNNGVMYYEARFQHFAGAVPGEDDLAPWNKKEGWEGSISGGTTKVAYPDGKDKTKKENYLGRYGMVRNNWYDVKVTEFKNFGYPADPSGQVNNPDFDDPNTPDDNIKEYIAVKIHVLSWAKRTQSWGF